MLLSLILIFKNVFILCVWMLYLNVFVHHVHGVSVEARRGHQLSKDFELQTIVSHYVGVRTRTQEQGS